MTFVLMTPLPKTPGHEGAQGVAGSRAHSCGLWRPLPAPSTHYPVRRRRAPDEALDLALLPVEGVLRLGAGDDGGACGGNRWRRGFRKAGARLGPSWGGGGGRQDLCVQVKCKASVMDLLRGHERTPLSQKAQKTLQGFRMCYCGVWAPEKPPSPLNHLREFKRGASL